jgi:hypothetical protein
MQPDHIIKWLAKYESPGPLGLEEYSAQVTHEVVFHMHAAVNVQFRAKSTRPFQAHSKRHRLWYQRYRTERTYLLACTLEVSSENQTICEPKHDNKHSEFSHLPWRHG